MTCGDPLSVVALGWHNESLSLLRCGLDVADFLLRPSPRSLVAAAVTAAEWELKFRLLPLVTAAATTASPEMTEQPQVEMRAMETARPRFFCANES